MKVALVHDWLTGMRGGEYVLEAIAELFPSAEIFTLLYVPGKLSPEISSRKRHTSYLQKIPAAQKRYRHFLPLMPHMIQKFDFTDFDLILSSSHCVAKGIRKPKGAVHVSYVHAPMRYIWDRYDDYFGKGKASPWVRAAARLVRGPLQKWDRETSATQNVDLLIANSHFIAHQIQEAYGRTSQVIHPFVDLNRFKKPRSAGKSYLMVGAFAPNKRVDLAIEAFNRLKLPLLIVGTGQEEARLKKMAGPHIDFLGPLSNSAIEDLYAKSKAFIFPGLEDFGITPLEAMASGLPVIAYGAGGALETVVHGKTGLHFTPQTAEALAEAVLKVESGEFRWNEDACREQARGFSRSSFQNQFRKAVEETWVKAGKSLGDLHSVMEPPTSASNESPGDPPRPSVP